jgi:hypothetical protein
MRSASRYLGCSILLVALSALFVAGDARAVPFDSDGDGYTDAVEDNLGSDKADILSTPESIAVLGTCIDGIDNDLDLATDAADPGCDPPTLFRDSFPPGAGLDIFDSEMTLQGLSFGACQLDFEGRGPTVVSRGVPSGGVIQTEIVAMQLTGTGTPLNVNCGGLPVGVPFDLTIVEDPAQASAGTVQSTGSLDFPAESFFDVSVVPDVPGNPPLSLTVENTINSIPPYHSPGNPKLNPNCYAVPGLEHLHCPKPPLDHFKCYKSKVEKLTISLEDQFEPETVQLVKSGRKADTFCNPVAKTVAGATTPIFDPSAHLSCYKIKDVTGADFVQRDVDIDNQFGPQTLKVLKPDTLCVPTQKDPETEPEPAALDHFKCYKVRAKPFKPALSAVLVDQFHTEDVAIVKPFSLCNPVKKTVAGETIEIGDSEAHLVCYKFTSPTPFTPVTKGIRNQFGIESFTARKPFTLCVPSLKEHACERTSPPACGGACDDPTEECLPNAAGDACECTTPGQQLCADSQPAVCDLSCPNAGDECVYTGTACECFTPDGACNCNDPCAVTCPDTSVALGLCLIQGAAGGCTCTALCPGVPPLCTNPVCDDSPCDAPCPGGGFAPGNCSAQSPDPAHEGCLCSNFGGIPCP